MPTKLDTPIFIERAEKKHGKGTYGYGYVNYTGIDKHVLIVLYPWDFLSIGGWTPLREKL